MRTNGVETENIYKSLKDTKELQYYRLTELIFSRDDLC